MSTQLITRRTLLDCAVRLAAAPAGLSLLSEWARAAQAHVHTTTAPAEPSFFADYRPQFFSPADFQALQNFTELLIPTDDTPGAREAHCCQFIDFVLHSSTSYAPEVQRQWHDAMRALEKAGFHAADPTARATLLQEIARPEVDSTAHHPAYQAYRLIKRENTFAFYTARAGMIDALDYRGNTYNIVFPACTHPEHHEV